MDLNCRWGSSHQPSSQPSDPAQDAASKAPCRLKRWRSSTLIPVRPPSFSNVAGLFHGVEVDAEACWFGGESSTALVTSLPVWSSNCNPVPCDSTNRATRVSNHWSCVASTLIKEATQGRALHLPWVILYQPQCLLEISQRGVNHFGPEPNTPGRVEAKSLAKIIYCVKQGFHPLLDEELQVLHHLEPIKGKTSCSSGGGLNSWTPPPSLSSLSWPGCISGRLGAVWNRKGALLMPPLPLTYFPRSISVVLEDVHRLPKPSQELLAKHQTVEALPCASRPPLRNFVQSPRTSAASAPPPLLPRGAPPEWGPHLHLKA